jgi:chromosomal replication initiation ATPase DnaA
MAGAKQIVPDTGFRMRELKARPRLVEVMPATKLYRLPVAIARKDLSPHTPLQRIIDLVARMHGVSFAAVMGKSRRRHVVLARFAAICAVKEIRPCMTLPTLGRLFGRDHTSILNALDRRAAGERE